MIEAAARTRSAGSEITFLLGRAGTGKTRRCIASLLENEAGRQEAFYLVPEQSTYLADRQLLESSRPMAICHVSTLSFRRLAHSLDVKAPNAGGPTLDPAGRRILLRALFTRLDPATRVPFESVKDRPGFIENLVTAVKEFRLEARRDLAGWLSGITPDTPMPDGLRRKLRLLGELYHSYDATLAERKLRDPDRILFDAPDRIRGRSAAFKDRPFYVDGFLSFTNIETEILLALAESGASLTIALCLDPALAGETPDVQTEGPGFRLREWPADLLKRIAQPSFLAPLRTWIELAARFKAAGHPIRIESLSPKTAPRFVSQDIQEIEESILSRNASPIRTPSRVDLLAARDPTHEVEIWARRIDRWIRCDKDTVRPGEIVVIVRDLEQYRPLVEETFRRFNIPVFIDQHWDITSRPLVRTLLDALQVLRSGWQRDAVIGYLRSPLLSIPGGEVDLLDNLSLETGYDFDRWTGAPWVALRRPPRTRYARTPEAENQKEAEHEPLEETSDRGEGSTGDISREDRIEGLRTSIANRLRIVHLEPLKTLEVRLRAKSITGIEAVAALRDWIHGSGISQRALGDPENGTDSRREWEAVENVLSRIGDETKEEPLTLDSFSGLLLAGLTSLRLGRTPTGLDRVTLAEVQRSRLGEVKRAVVGGLSARDFPRGAASSGIFTEPERERLASLGLDLGTPNHLRQDEEAYFLYIALTRASEQLLLTRPALDLEGRSLEPSPFIKEILRTLPGLEEKFPSPTADPSDLTDAATPEELAASVGAYIASRLDRRRTGRMVQDPEATRGRDRTILTVYNRLLLPTATRGEEGRRLIEETSRLWGYDNRTGLPEAVVRAAIPGSTLLSSVGRLEMFARCPYQHFAQHMLKLKPRPSAQITPIEGGLLAHRALEVLYGDGVPPTDRETIRERLEGVFLKIADDESLRVYQVDPSGRFRWRRTRGQLLRFLTLEAQRLSRSLYKPEKLEFSFGSEGVEPLRLPLPEGAELRIRGRIDRIDVADRGALREALVIDYKSSPTSGRGRSVDVEEGIDLQLAVYLLVCKEILGIEPGGALYAPVLPRPTSDPSKDPLNPLRIQWAGLVPGDRTKDVSGDLKILKKTTGRRIENSADLMALLDGARATLARYAGAILGGRIDVAPVRYSSRLPCEYCEFRSLCRVDEEYNPTRRSPREKF